MADEWDVMPKAVKSSTAVPAKVKPRATFVITAALIVVFGLGILLGRLTAPQRMSPTATTAKQAQGDAIDYPAEITKAKARMDKALTDYHKHSDQGQHDLAMQDWKQSGVEYDRMMLLMERWRRAGGKMQAEWYEQVKHTD